MPKKTSFGTLYQGHHGNFLASKTATLANTLVATPPACCHHSRRILFSTEVRLPVSKVSYCHSTGCIKVNWSKLNDSEG